MSDANEDWADCVKTYTAPCKRNEVLMKSKLSCIPKAMWEAKENGGSEIDMILSLGICLYWEAFRGPIDPDNALAAYNNTMDAIATCGNRDEAAVSNLSLHSNVGRLLASACFS